MDFLIRNRIFLLFAGAAIVLIAALFWPEAKKPGDMQKYYTRDRAQLLSLRYRGTMNFDEKNKVKIDYEILREENPAKPREFVYRVHVHSLSSAQTTLRERIKQLEPVQDFYASALVHSIVQDWSSLDFYYILPHDVAKDNEYGLQNCENLLHLKFKADEREFCIGTPSQGETRRYILDRSKDKLLITPDYTIRRLLNNIFAQREQSLHPYGNDSFDLVELEIPPETLKKYPLLSEKTGGKLRLRMLVKKDGPAPINVWHVENLLSIKPSHAAELAQFLSALRIPALLAQSAHKPETPLAELQSAVGVAGKTPALSGSFLRKRTDQQDLLLTRFAFFAPGIRHGNKAGWQTDKTEIKVLDTLAITAFNAGYLTADNFPRFTAMLQKFENDLREAAKTGSKEESSASKPAEK